jgi:hypothetical protein
MSQLQASQLQGIVRGDTLQKIASAAFITGAVLLIVFNILSPRPDNPTNMQSVLTTMSDQKVLTQLSQLLLALGMWGVMIGSAGVYRSIKERGAAWSRLGFYGIIIGTSLWSITFGLGTVTVNTAAEWAAATGAEQAAAYGVAAAVSTATSGLETMSIIMLWLALILLGIGMARSAIYPRWLGYIVVVLGIAMVVVVGIPKFFMGYTSTLLVVFGVLALLTTAWFLATGIWVARKAW